MEDLTIKYPWNRQTGLHNLFGIINKQKKKEHWKRFKCNKFIFIERFWYKLYNNHVPVTS